MATSGSKTITAYTTRSGAVAGQLKFSWSEKSQSISNNTTTIDWKLQLISLDYGYNSGSTQQAWRVVVNGTSYSGETTVGIANNATKTLASGSTTITHKSDGTKTFSYSFSQAFNITFADVSIGTKSGSGSGTLDTIPRKSTLTVAAGTLGTAQTLTISEKASAFTHKLKYECGDTSGWILGDADSTSTTLSKSWTPPLSLASENTTGTSVSIKFTLYTFNGSTNIGSNAYTKTFSIPPSVKPSCSVVVTDPTGHKDTYGGFIKGLSKFKVVVTATKAYESAIGSYSTTANGSIYTTSSFTTGVLKSSGSLSVKATVKDRRGRSGIATVSGITVLDYSPPIVSELIVRRCNADGTLNDKGEYVKVSFSGSVTSLNNKNTASYLLKYKKTFEDEYPASQKIALSEYANNYSVTNGSYIFEADSGSSYDVVLEITDNFGTIPRNTTASTAFTLMHWLASGLGMAIGKIAELTGVFDIGLKTKFSGGILQPVLSDGTDLNSVVLPCIYTGNAATTHGYLNCPVTTATSFTLEVMSSGDEGQLLQRVTTCTKTKPLVYERFYYSGSWGDWVRVSDFGGKLLWSGGMYMASGHTIALSEAISKQPKGVVLVFSEYVDGEAKNQSFQREFLDKYTIAENAGSGHVFKLCTSNLAYFATKYLYISDDKIVGHDNNNQTITGACGITATNSRFVLRYVIGI